MVKLYFKSGRKEIKSYSVVIGSQVIAQPFKKTNEKENTWVIHFIPYDKTNNESKVLEMTKILLYHQRSNN